MNQESNINSSHTTSNDSQELSFAQSEGKCYCCGKPGHRSPDCHHKGKPKSEWHFNKINQSSHQNHLNVQNPSSSAASVAGTTISYRQPQPAAPSSQTHLEWSNAQVHTYHMQFMQTENMKLLVLLDSQSTTSIYGNEAFVTNIVTVEDWLRLVTNAGTLMTNQMATVPGFHKPVWFHKDAVTNILALHHVTEKHRVTYDSALDTAFFVHYDYGIVKYDKTPNGLHAYEPTRPKQDIGMLNSVDENKLFYTDRQIAQAKRARDLYINLGTPSIKDFKTALTANFIANCPVTSEEVDLAEKIFGPDTGSLKGKTTRTKPAPVVSDYISIPLELVEAQKKVTLCIDVVFVNGLPFLATVSRRLMYRTAQHIPDRSQQSFMDVLKVVFNIYKKAGFTIGTVLADLEFKPVLTQVESKFNTTVNYCSTAEHVPEAERNNRVIQERTRATFHRLKYPSLPKKALIVLVMESTKSLNYFPPMGGVSPYYSPHMILHQQQLEYSKHCSVSFGDYIQAPADNTKTNDQRPRTLDCIYLRRTPNSQSGHQLLHLHTGEIIIRSRAIKVPLTQQVIDMVHRLAIIDKMPSDLKIANKTGVILYDSTWIAGVDYVPQTQDDIADNADQDFKPKSEKDEDLDEHYDEIDPNELDDLHAEAIDTPNEVEEQEDEQENEDEEQEEQHEDEEAAAADGSIGDESEESDNEEPVINPQITRTGRISRPPAKFADEQANYFTTDQATEINEYSDEYARLIANVMHSFNSAGVNKSHKHHAFLQTHNLKQGLKKFGQRGNDAASEEMKQLHDRKVFSPVHLSDLSPTERKRAMSSLIFLVEKRDGRVKARTCANGSTQREYVSKEEASSPTAITESLLLTATIDAKEGRDVMTADIPNAFVQTHLDESPTGERTIMKITGKLVEMLVELDPHTYKDFVTIEKGVQVLHVDMWMALYGMIKSSLLYYKKWRGDLVSIGFEVNPYDPCVANRMINGHQHTVAWHVDDVKSSHVDPKVNDNFHKWMQKHYGDPSINNVKVVRGKRHDYLGMVLDYSTPGVVKIDMNHYVQAMIDEFPEELNSQNAKQPWNQDLFNINPDSQDLNKDHAAVLHTFVAKGLFLAKRGRPDILPAIAFLTTRVSKPTKQDWTKLVKMMKFLKATHHDVLTLAMEDTTVIKWHLDASFAVHDNMRSHTGAIMSLGKGSIQSVSRKQKINTRSSTEAELVSFDDILSKLMWTKLFLESQGYEVKENIVYRDNQSSMKLETNGKASSGKRTRHFNIKYFLITDLIARNEVTLQFCPTAMMIADYMTKPLVGKKFTEFRKVIMNLPDPIALASRSVLGEK